MALEAKTILLYVCTNKSICFFLLKKYAHLIKTCSNSVDLDKMAEVIKLQQYPTQQKYVTLTEMTMWLETKNVKEQKNVEGLSPTARN